MGDELGPRVGLTGRRSRVAQAKACTKRVLPAAAMKPGQHPYVIQSAYTPGQ